MGLGTVLLAIGTGISAFGTIQQGQAAAAQAEGAAAMAEFNAQVAEQEAKAIEQRTAFESRRQAEAADRQQSALVAALGASGVQPGAGAPLRIQVEQEKESELETLLIGFEGQIGAQRARNQASLDRLQGKIFSQKAGFARTAGAIGAGATLLTGFSRVFS